MKAKDLASKLLEQPDFEVRFTFSEDEDCGDSWGYVVRSFDNIKICDLCHSDKIILLSGDQT